MFRIVILSINSPNPAVLFDYTGALLTHEYSKHGNRFKMGISVNTQLISPILYMFYFTAENR